MKTFFNTQTILIIIIVILVSVLSFNLFTNGFSKKEHNTEATKLEVNDFIIRMKDQMVELDSSLRRKNQSALLKLDEVEIEAHFVIKSKPSKSTENRYEILTVGNKDTYKNEQIQKITLHLKRNVSRGN